MFIDKYGLSEHKHCDNAATNANSENANTRQVLRGEAWVRGQGKTSKLLGPFGLLDFTMLRLVLAWRAFWKLRTVYFFKFPIFFSDRVELRITETVDTESVDTGARPYLFIFIPSLRPSDLWNICSVYTGWLKSLCAPDDYRTKTRKIILNSFSRFRNVDRAIPNTVRRVNKRLQNGEGHDEHYL
jgi:hypothetical protein